MVINAPVSNAHISIHAPLAGCDHIYIYAAFSVNISIHAPLAGCDILPRCTRRSSITDFNPRTPCGVRPHNHLHTGQCFYFNPRTPCGVRPSTCKRWRSNLHFNPRTPCGVRQPAPFGIGVSLYFNPRTPCGVRLPIRRKTCWTNAFQSTHPLRGATAKTYKENCTFFELADKLSARIAAKKPSAKADRCA